MDDIYGGFDLSQPNDKPGTCCKCRGTGVYRWGAVGTRNEKRGTCFSCKGTGKQSAKQIKTNGAYNRFKVAAIVRADFARGDYVRDPGEDAADRWNEAHGDRFGEEG